jgi:hypothetical protein
MIAALAAMTAMIAPASAAEIGRVKRSSGAAAIERGKAKLPTAPGTQLQTGDVLVTGKNGQISLTFIDDTRFAVGPNSRLALSQFAYDRARQTGSFLTEVNRGSVAVVSGQIAKSGRDAMKVRTPTALLGVRGTRFIVTAGK